MTPLEESNAQFIAAWQTICGRFPGSTADDLDGVMGVFARVPISFFNVCFLTRPVIELDDLRRRVASAVAHGTASALPWLLTLCEEWIPDGADDACREAGLMPVLGMTGMAADALAPPRRPRPDLTFARVRDADTALQVAAINTDAYGMPPEDAHHLALAELWPEDTYGYVGAIDGTPVTCAATVPVDGRLYVAWVATHPAHHRKGYAEAAMRESLHVAADATGLQRTILHATDAGRPVYAAMGYVPTSRFTMYAMADASAHHA